MNFTPEFSDTTATAVPDYSVSRPDPPTCGWFIKELYGPNTPNVPVFGSRAAIEELQLAVERDGLFIQKQPAPAPADNIKIAYQHLQQKGIFPQDEQMRGLHDLSPRDGLALGIDPEDYVLSSANTVIASPPFKTLDVDRVLGALRVVAKYYDEYSEWVLIDSKKHSYQLGIVTMTRRNDLPDFKVQLFPSQENVAPTGTLWLYRWCVRDATGGYSEQWRALGDGKFDMSMLADFVPVFAPPPASRKRGHSLLEDEGDPMDHVLGKHSAKKQRLTTVPHSLPDEDIFNLDPENIRGETILRLAANYSNTELFERINTGLANKKLPLINSCNVITRRITLAIQSKAAQSKEHTVQEIREDLNQARKMNGVKKRMNVRTNKVKEANKAKVAGMSEGNFGGGAFE